MKMTKESNSYVRKVILSACSGGGNAVAHKQDLIYFIYF